MTRDCTLWQNPKPAGGITHPSWPVNSSGSPTEVLEDVDGATLFSLLTPQLGKLKEEPKLNREMDSRQVLYHECTWFLCVGVLLTRTVGIKGTILTHNATVTTENQPFCVSTN